VDGQKKKHKRFFTMGYGMMAYFDVKDPAKATLKSVEGMFPVDLDSKVNKKGAVNGVAFKLPWDKAYEFLKYNICGANVPAFCKRRRRRCRIGQNHRLLWWTS
jgi:hypothetical protein